jgi:hypothetical protein
VKKLLFGSRRRIVAVVVSVVVLAAAAIGAYAYFTSTGSGTGQATMANPTNVVVNQVGAGYDSLIPLSAAVPAGPGPYIQDQCFQCAQITELGATIKLQNPGLQRLGNIVVAFRNWGAGFSGVPITVSIVGTSLSSTVSPTVPAKQPSGRPTSFTVTFPFNGQFVDQQFTYKIAFNSAAPADGLNVALSSSANQISTGSNPDGHKIWVNAGVQPSSTGD